MAKSKGLVSRGREMENRGTAPSNRGWWTNTFVGLNPYLFWVYVVVAVVLVVIGSVAVATGRDSVSPFFNVGWLLLLAYVGRSLPKLWTRSKWREPASRTNDAE